MPQLRSPSLCVDSLSPRIRDSEQSAEVMHSFFLMYFHFPAAILGEPESTYDRCVEAQRSIRVDKITLDNSVQLLYNRLVLDNVNTLDLIVTAGIKY